MRHGLGPEHVPDLVVDHGASAILRDPDLRRREPDRQMCGMRVRTGSADAHARQAVVFQDAHAVAFPAPPDSSKVAPSRRPGRRRKQNQAPGDDRPNPSISRILIPPSITFHRSSADRDGHQRPTGSCAHPMNRLARLPRSPRHREVSPTARRNGWKSPPPASACGRRSSLGRQAGGQADALAGMETLDHRNQQPRREPRSGRRRSGLDHDRAGVSGQHDRQPGECPARSSSAARLGRLDLFRFRAAGRRSPPGRSTDCRRGRVDLVERLPDRQDIGTMAGSRRLRNASSRLLQQRCWRLSFSLLYAPDPGASARCADRR